MDYFNNKCLLCLLHDKNLKNVLSQDDDGIEIGAKFNFAICEDNITLFYLKIVNYKPDKPKYICIHCLENLNRVYKFKQKCLTNLKYLNNYVEKIKTGDILDSSDQNQNCSENENEVKIVSQSQNNAGSRNIEKTNEIIFIKDQPKKNQDTICSLGEKTQNILEVELKNESTILHDEIDIKEEPFLIEEIYIENETASNDGQISTSFIDEDSNNYNKQFKCCICNKIFNRKSTLQQHIRIHTNEKPFKCNVCNKTFRQSGNLFRHRKVHSSLKSHVCDICQKSFKFADHLKVHKRLHTGEQPYKCDICNRKFKQTAHLLKHRRLHRF